MVTSSSSPAGPRPKLRTKTFTGCWTCRSRHVKCDEQRPHCQRCLQNGWQCQGYNVRLEWSGTTGGNASQKRRRADPMRLPPDQCLSSKAVTALLADLDNNSHATVPYESGPFSVFPVSAPSNDSSRLDRRRSESTERRSGMPASPASRSCSELGSEAITISSDADHERLDAERPVVFEATNVHPKPASPELPNENDPLSLTRGISPYEMSKPQIELVHHWVTFISGNLLLIDTPDNPCRTIFVPMALKGVGLGHTEPSMYRTIFHAICSASAFSLYHLRKDDRYHSLALTHDQLALYHLRHNLNGGTSVNELTLAGILSCITAEAISGRRHRWRTHLAGALSLLEKDDNPCWARSPVASSMLQSYVSLSSLCNMRLPTHLVSHLDAPPELSDYLERSHGMTRPLVRFLSHLNDKLESGRSVSAEELDGLELQLYLSFPRLSTSDTPNTGLVQHAVNAFYYATVIYFRRTIRQVPSHAVQDLVEKAVEDLEAAETLSQGKGGTAYNWPSLVVAAECGSAVLQDRMLTWFQRKRRHGLQSICVIRDLVTLLWQRREAAGSDVHWQDVAKEADFDIMFV